MNKLELDIEESISIKKLILKDEVLKRQIVSIADSCVNSLKEGHKVIFCGNGGSFGDAQHLSAEFISRFRFNRNNKTFSCSSQQVVQKIQKVKKLILLKTFKFSNVKPFPVRGHLLEEAIRQ